MQEKIRLGISACLLGEKVRYDGTHNHDRMITGLLGRFVEFVPVCPEAETGLGTPREAMRLVGRPDAPRLVTIHSGRDLTDLMLDWCQFRLEELTRENLCGFIFKAKSPSSGMERVKVYNEQTGIPAKVGAGLFAKAFMAYFPLLPVEEDGRLHDHRLRENFIERVFVFRRWRQARAAGDRGTLVAFHTSHKLLIMAHSTKVYRELGRLVATAKEYTPEVLFANYERQLMAALRLLATPSKNANVLQHIMVYFKKMLAAEEKQELLTLIDQYQHEDIPLIVPVTLLNHYTRKYGQEYLANQFYLQPHPVELQLRNHV